MKHSGLVLATAAAGILLARGARADDQPAPGPPPAAPAPAATTAAPAAWASAIKVSGYLDAGFTANPSGPDTGLNYGRLFDDRANELLLNQLSLTIERDLDPKATGVDVGFSFHAYYGSDARYTHFIGGLDYALSGIDQLDIVEANVQLHLPILTSGGMDVKIGKFSSPWAKRTLTRW